MRSSVRPFSLPNTILISEKIVAPSNKASFSASGRANFAFEIPHRTSSLYHDLKVPDPSPSKPHALLPSI